MFEKILVANRGEIACRVIRTARRMGIKTVAIHSDADRAAMHARLADEAIHIGPSPTSESYIVIEKVIAAARESGAQAVHPGYGFLSENPKFAEELERAGITFIGPPKEAIRDMGDKITSKKLAAEAGVSTVPGYMGLVESAAEAARISGEIGYPVMIKASAGGGGKGMRIAWNDEEAKDGFERSRSEAASSFGDDRIFIEKFVTQPRHIEIQVLADGHGNTIYLNERECSIQRRNQKVIEEAPSPFLDPQTRKAMGEQAVALAKAVKYKSAGTVEFIVDGERNFYFLEMNTRLQVEHPVTELITGIDLVEQMINVAAGKKLEMGQSDVGINGWAMESRIYAEDPYRGFLPSTGRLTRYRPPEEAAQETLAVRNDTGVHEGGEISIYYDPMIAKLCSWSKDRASAIEVMKGALDEFEIEGIRHNIPFLSAVMEHPRFVSGDITTAFIEEEYPDGFKGAAPDSETLKRLVAGVACMRWISETRNAEISGQMPNHERRVREDWTVVSGGESWNVRVEPAEGQWRVRLESGEILETMLDWVPGKTVARLSVDGEAMSVKVSPLPTGFRLRARGLDLEMKALRPRQHALSAFMRERELADTSRLLVCPMPGLVISVDVQVGDEVQDGQALCSIEAMKMENVLRAERKGKIKKINAKEGDSLNVDDIIMEME